MGSIEYKIINQWIGGSIYILNILESVFLLLSLVY